MKLWRSVRLSRVQQVGGLMELCAAQMPASEVPVRDHYAVARFRPWRGTRLHRPCAAAARFMGSRTCPCRCVAHRRIRDRMLNVSASGSSIPATPLARRLCCRSACGPRRAGAFAGAGDTLQWWIDCTRRCSTGAARSGSQQSTDSSLGRTSRVF
jgi:hypothetical protein